MRYTYRDECIIGGKDDIGSLIYWCIWICATLAIFLADVYLIFFKGSDGIGGVIVILFLIVDVAMGICIIKAIHKRRKKALELRRKAMEQGSRFAGKIVGAGMEKESERYETRDEDNRTEMKYRTRLNYWIDVTYFDPQEQKVKRFRALHMIRSMKRFIGCGVDVYVWHEWCPEIQKDLALTYIDTYALE